MKLKWKVSEAPTGRYRSFEFRHWPTAERGDKMAVSLSCKNDYVPAAVKVGNHEPIRIYIAEYKIGVPGFSWRQLREPAKTLKEAKARAQAFCDAHPDWFC